MAYKDEYEVARLYSDGEFLHKVQQQFEGDFELRFNLAPPLFSKRDPSTGHLIKQEFGPWMLKAFGWLARLRRLRGTRLDIFGYTAERRQERADIDDYIALLAELCAGLNNENYATAVELAALPSRLRGFGHVKDRNRENLVEQRATLLRQFRGDTVDSVTIVNAA
jgi:indolepyruvate ferredoxin oxidoreductase